MKNLILFLFLVAAIGVQAQTTVTSKALGDQIVLQKSAFEITPIIVTANGDTARSMSWLAYSVLRDTTNGFRAQVILYDKTGATLSNVDQFIPGAVFGRWALLLNKIDAYILNQRKRLIKQ